MSPDDLKKIKNQRRRKAANDLLNVALLFNPQLKTKVYIMKKLFGFFSRMFGSDPKRRGRTVALSALLAFNAPQDAIKFRDLKAELVAFLRAGQKLDRYMIKRFSDQAAERLNVNPLAFRVLVASLVDQMESENGDTNARLFIEGIVEALDMLGE